MKSKLLILSLLVWIGSFAQSVPNTNTFHLTDVTAITGGSLLSGAFTNSTDSYFDPAYKGSKDRLSNFRNYTVASCPALPSISAASCLTATQTTIDYTATVSGDGGSGCTVTSRGVQCSTDNTFTTGVTSFSAAAGGTGQYYVTVTGLSANTLYYLRPWATNGYGTYYANSLVGSGCFTLANPPTVSITTANTLGDAEITIVSDVTSAGTLLTRGICYVLGSGTPTIANNPTTGTLTTGSQNITLTSLTANTLYTARAYSSNLGGLSYSSNFTFTTQQSLFSWSATTSSWTCPTYVTSITVACWGAGGAGGPATGTASRGGGGAGGTYSQKTISVTPGNSYTITAAVATTSNATSIRSGASSSFGTLVVASGGTGGSATSGTAGTGASASTSGSVGDIINIGGNGGNGTAAGYSGGGGGAGGESGAGGNATLATSGIGGGSVSGGGGFGVNVANTRNAGSTYGGGGSGGLSSSTTDRSGGNGGSGLVQIYF